MYVGIHHFFYVQKYGCIVTYNTCNHNIEHRMSYVQRQQEKKTVWELLVASINTTTLNNNKNSILTTTRTVISTTCQKMWSDSLISQQMYDLSIGHSLVQIGDDLKVEDNFGRQKG